METQHLGGPAAACVGLAVVVSEWRGWLNLDLYQILPLRDRAFGRGTDRNPLAGKVQSNPVRHNILRGGSISLKHWESLTVVVWHLLWLLIYLNFPSVIKIPNVKKNIKAENKQKKDLQESECFLRGRLNSSRVHILYSTPHLCMHRRKPSSPNYWDACEVYQETNSEVSAWTLSWGGRRIFPLASRRKWVLNHCIFPGCPTTLSSVCTEVIHIGKASALSAAHPCFHSKIPPLGC